MEREFLADMGLEKDAIDKIMAEHGKTINAHKDQVTSLNAQITDLNEKITSGKKEFDDFKETVKDYDEIKADRDKIKGDYDALDAKHIKSVKDNALLNEAQKLGAKDAKDIARYVDASNLTIDDNGNITGLEAVAKLKEEKPYLFADAKGDPKKPTGKDPAGKGDDDDMEKFSRALGLK